MRTHTFFPGSRTMRGSVGSETMGRSVEVGSLADGFCGSSRAIGVDSGA